MAGIDEAGRGPLAGPVYVAAVCFPFPLTSELRASLEGLTDSKKLSPGRRDLFFDQLTNHPAISFAICSASPEDIDRYNILEATHRTMRAAASALKPAAEHLLVDGLPVKNLPCPGTAIVQGDSKSLSIAAASILAKVSRDRVMEALDLEFPQYGFARHKGYGTRAHLEALRIHGPCPHHRRSFKPVSQQWLDF